MGSSDEGECISVYTFFSIKDRSRSWLNQRGQTHGVISTKILTENESNLTKKKKLNLSPELSNKTLAIKLN